MAFRLVLAGWAGGMLLWFVACFAIEALEKDWGRKDYFVLPRKIDGQYYNDAPLASLKTAAARAFVRAALAREKANQMEL